MNADGSGLHTVCDAKCGPGLEEAAWSPNGRRLAFSNAFMVNASYFTRPISSIWVANTDGSGVRQITQPGCDSSKDAMEGCFFDSAPEWSPDGSEIAFSRLGAAENLEIVHPDGSHLRALATCRPHKEGCSIDPSWSPAGDEIAWAGRKQIEITTLSGVTSTLSTCAGSSCPDPYKPKWSPNGQEFLFFTGPEYFGTTVWTIRRDGSGLRRVARDTQCCTAWIAHAALPGRVPDPTTAGHAALHLAGTLAFSDYLPTKRHRALGLLSLSTGRTHVIHPPARRSNGWPSWSADGRKLVVAATDEWEDNYYFYVVNRDGSHVRDLLHLRSAHGAKGEMALSPDGKRIAFTTRDGIELIRPGGDPRHARRLFKFPKHFRSASEPAWSPNGRELVFSRAPKGDPNDALYTIRADGTRLTRLTNLAGDQSHPVWSPNGREIAFDWWTSAGDGVYLIRPDGTHLRRLTTQAIPTAVRPAWSPDGRYLVFFPNTGGRTKTPIDIVDAKTGRVTVLRTTIYGQAEAPSWSPY
jgi:TolB protein